MNIPQRIFFNKIDDILYQEWNPIGFPVPKDEYRAYVPKIFQLILAGCSEKEIAKELSELELGIVGSSNNANCERVARLIVEEKAHLL